MNNKIIILILFICCGFYDSFSQDLTSYCITVDTVSYNSIASTGTSLTFSNLDDGCATFTMPFAMPFGTSTIASGSTVYVSSNGYICIGGNSSATGTTCPTSGTSFVINPLINQDAHLGRYSESGAYYKTENGKLIIEYVGLGRYSSPYGYMSYQVSLSSDGVIDIVYDSVNVSSAAILRGVLRDGSAGSTVYFGGSWASPTISTTSQSFPTNKMPERGLHYKIQPSSGSIGTTGFWSICPSGQRLNYTILSSSPASVSVYGSTTLSGNVQIPATVTFNNISYTVVALSREAFEKASLITHVIIPNTVIEIGKDAFHKCYKLTSIDIPNSVTAIGSTAFSSSGLKCMTIPNSVDSIGTSAFSGVRTVNYCGSASGSPWGAMQVGCFYEEGDLIFRDNTKTTALGYVGAGQDVVIPNTVDTIFDYAFYYCTNISSVTIPNSVTSIGSSAFSYCSGLTSLVIGNSVTSIGQSAFYCCSGLTSVIIPNGVTSIGLDAFYGCNNLRSVNYTGIIDNWCGINFGSITANPIAFSQNLFINGQLINNAIITTATQVKDYAFYKCSSLTSVTIPNTVSSIGDRAFSGCNNVDTLYYNARNLTTTSGWASSSNGFRPMKLKHLVIGDSVQALPSYVFYYQDSLTSVSIPNSVTTIGNDAFSYCSSLTSVHYEGTIADWCNISFSGSTSNPLYYAHSLKINDTLINKLIIPNTVNQIKNYAFYNCSSIDTLIIGETVSSIGSSAFYGCTGLTSLSIGSIVANIGSSAFSGCTGLSSIFSECTTAPSLGTSAFDNVPESIPVHIPCGSSASYLSRWPYFPNFVEAEWYQVSVSSEDSTRGYVSVMTQPTCTAPDGIIFAVANPGYVFDHWTDGVTNNPRNFTLCQDTLFEAVFVQSVVPDRYSVSVLPSNVAYGSITGGGVYDVNTQAHLEAVPNYGYHFVRWSDGQTQNPRTITVQNDTMFAALFAPNTYNVFAYPANPAMGSTTGGGTMEYLSSITIEASPSLGCHFVSWSDNVADNPRVMVVSRDSVLIAQFEYDQYMVSGNPTSDSTGMIVGLGTYLYNAQVVLMAVPNVHYHFVAWFDGVSAVNRTVTITSDTAFFAIFAIDTHQVNVVSSNPLMGSVLGSGEYAYGANTSLSAIPNYGYHFVQWSDGDLSNPKNLPVLNDVSLIALFAPNSYSVSISSSDTVMGCASGSGEFEYLSTCSMYAVSNYGYHFVQWSDGSTMNPRSIVVDRDSSLMAFFAPDVFRIRTGVNDPSMGTVSNDANVNYLSQIVLTATSYDHCHFVQWNDGSTTNPRTLTVVRDSSFTAFFEREPSYLVVVNSNDLNRGSVSGNGTFYIGEKDTLYAEAYEHYYFSHWSDGNTNNPRVVTVLGDATYTAVFEGEIVDVATSVNNTLMGSVSGGGEYHYGDIVTLVANPKEGYHFMQWSDGSTANPYMFTAYESMSIEAQFGSNEGIDGVEWDYSVTSRGNEIIIYGVSGRKVQVYDISGRRIAYIDRSNDTEFIAVPARGVYMVKVGVVPARKVVVM